MLARLHHHLLLGLALLSLTSLGCGKSKGDGAGCTGGPISCVVGGPSGTGIACQDLAMNGTCVGGQWTCPKGMVDTRDCTCGAPGLSCSPQTCTPQGPVCLDAGVDAHVDAVAHGEAGAE
jgi:hypothetical protein